MLMDDDDDDDVTVCDPNPWGARQRIAPRKTFKAAVSRIITIVPALVKQLPPPVPPMRRRPQATPALAAPVFAPAVASGRISAPVLPAPIPSISALTYAARARQSYDSTLPVKRVQMTQLKRIASVLAGAVVALTIAAIVQSMTRSPSPRASAGASLAGSLATADGPRREERHVMLSAPAMTVTPIEPAVTPTVTPIEPTVSAIAEEVQPVAKKPARSKRPRRIVAGDTSTPLGNLRPRRFH